MIVSTYNGEKYIKEQLQSILNQTCQPNEVIIRDDGSTDATVAICNAFIEANSLRGWKVVCNTKNMGWAENFLEGFRKAQGDIIFPCDQDDIWLENKIERMSKKIEEIPEIGLLMGGCVRQFEDGNSSRREEKHFSEKLTKLPFNEKMIFVDYPGCVYCFTKSFFREVDQYSFKDYPHDALLLRMGRLMGKAYYYDFPAIYWRRHMSNATGKPVRENQEMQRRITYYIDCLLQMKKYCDEHEGYEEHNALIDKNIEFYRIRLEAFENKRIIGKNSLFTCLKYLRFYPVPKSIIGDLVRLLN